MFQKVSVKNRSNILLLIALLVYNSFFYAESLGLNILLFVMLLYVFQWVLFKENFKSRNVQISVGMTVFLAGMIVWHNSLLSKWMFFISYGISLGFLLQPSIRFIGYSLLTTLLNFSKPPLEIFSWSKEGNESSNRGVKLSKMLMLAALPVVIVFLFYIIYRQANPVFADITDRALASISDWIADIFKHISFARLLFLLIGLFLLSGILLVRNNGFFAKEDAQFVDEIARSRRRIFGPHILMHFKNEFLSGIILLVLMNAMLLVLNIIDINYIWINFQIPSGVSLSEMVHQGTEWLIVSIVLSMVVVIYIFRANQNFYSKNQWLKYLAYMWMAQNMILTISLIMRNNMYISWHALAYKRLGVYVFIALTFFGLVTMLLKINKAKSFFYLLRVNAWAAYCVMCAVCVVNWDVFIAKYNVASQKGAQLDTDFLLKLSPKAYPYIFEQLEVVGKQIEAHQNEYNATPLNYYSRESFKEKLLQQSEHYIYENAENTWLSYNVADAYAISYLNAKIKQHRENRN